MRRANALTAALLMLASALMAPAATITKTVQTDPLALQSVASNTVVISSDVTVTTALEATFFLRFGRRATTALTAAANFRIEASGASSGDGHWYPVAQLSTDVATAETEAVSGTVAAGQNVITVASTTNLVVGDIVFIDNSTIGNSEWCRVKAVVTNTSITCEDNLANAQTGSTLYDQGQIFAPVTISLTSIRRLRVVFDGSGTGQAVAVEVELITGDSIG